MATCAAAAVNAIRDMKQSKNWIYFDAKHSSWTVQRHGPSRVTGLHRATLQTQHEYWYDELVPGLHFIPFQQDVSDLEKVIVEALTNVSHLEYIAGQAKRFVLRRLNPSSIACYWGLLLREYSTLFNHTDLGQGSSPLLQ